MTGHRWALPPHRIERGASQPVSQQAAGHRPPARQHRAREPVRAQRVDVWVIWVMVREPVRAPARPCTWAPGGHAPGRFWVIWVTGRRVTQMTQSQRAGQALGHLGHFVTRKKSER